ncbi:hypothetical protein OIU92_31035 [Escherichia coli]|nr:hypothetical protein [Escherichia coli]
MRQAVASDAPCGEGSQTGDGEYRRNKEQVPQNVKTAAPETQQMMGLKTRERRKQDEYPKYPR